MSVIATILRGFGIAILCVLGFFFLPGACVTPFLAAEAVRALGGDDQWALAVMGCSFLISVTLLAIGDAINEEGHR